MMRTRGPEVPDHPGRGAAAIGRAVRLLASRRDLWVLCAAPILIALVAALLAVGIYVTVVVEPLWTWLGSVLDVRVAERLWEWLWLGPLHALAWLARVALAALGLVAVYLVLSALGAVIASPFLDALSRAVERSVRGTITEGPGGWRSIVGTVRNELLRWSALAGISIGIALVGLVPGGQIPALVLGIASAAGFLALEHTAHVFDRREVSFQARRRWLWRHRFTMLGFGGAAAASYTLPGLNLACLPVLTTAGTLLALDLEPAGAALTSAPACEP
jgi:CysZ protein